MVNLVKEYIYYTKYVALQEVGWQDSYTTKLSQKTVLNGKCEHTHGLGTGFAVHNQSFIK